MFFFCGVTSVTNQFATVTFHKIDFLFSFLDGGIFVDIEDPLDLKLKFDFHDENMDLEYLLVEDIDKISKDKNVSSSSDDETEDIFERVDSHACDYSTGYDRQILSNPGYDEPPSQWKEEQFTPVPIAHTQPAYLPIDTKCFDKYDYFKQYIDNDLVEHMVENTNRMYFKKTGKDLNLTVSELNTFIGINMVMSTINYPRLRMYWQQDYRLPMIVENMSKKRFQCLRNHIKTVFEPDVSQQERSCDKLWKVRPLLDKVVSGCNKQNKGNALCVDEMFIPLTGPRGAKPGSCKSKTMGLTAYILANPNGTVCDLQFSEKLQNCLDYGIDSFSTHENIVLKLTADLVPGHILYLNSYFTTERLVKELRKRGIMCTGTIADCRIPKLAVEIMKTEIDLKSKDLGSCQVLVNEHADLAITTWLDGKPITLLSSIHANATSEKCQRWSKKEKRYVTTNCPEVAKRYYENIRGVHIANKLLDVCPSGHRTRSWTQRFLGHMIDFSTTNAWLQYRADQISKNIPAKKIEQLRSYKLELGKYLIESSNDLSDVEVEDSGSENEALREGTRKGKRFIVPTPSEKKRTRGNTHLPHTRNFRTRCRVTGCSKKTTVICCSCGVALCLTAKRNCFKKFHS